MANYFQTITKNGHSGYFTPFLEQLNLSFLFHFELGKLLRMLWASMCRMGMNLQSSVIPMDPLPCPQFPPELGL